MLSSRSLRISGIVLFGCALLGLAAVMLTGRLAPSRFTPPAQEERVHLLAELARLRQSQTPQSAPITANAEMQALEAQLEALRRAAPGDPAEMMKRTQRDLERLQTESQAQPAQVQQAIWLARWALVLSIAALTLLMGLVIAFRIRSPIVR
ncbi:MAG TPA: hypothetical protein VH988_19815 [Thermoanaerobaculia bacterium]|jgi:hypothetical protein|nr:hypothetical protein [Thermoanaerobaculia bacterium]